MLGANLLLAPHLFPVDKLSFSIENCAAMSSQNGLDGAGNFIEVLGLVQEVHICCLPEAKLCIHMCIFKLLLLLLCFLCEPWHSAVRLRLVHACYIITVLYIEFLREQQCRILAKFAPLLESNHTHESNY